MKKAFFAFVALSLVISSNAFVFAQDKSPQKPNVPQSPMVLHAKNSPAPSVLSVFRLFNPIMADVLSSKLNLDSNQKTKLADILAKADESAEPKVEAQRLAAEKFVIVLAKNGSTDAEIKSAGDAAVKADADLLDERINTFSSIKNILNDQQKKDLAKFVADYTVIWRQNTFAANSSSK